jgi:hypothetical protein
MARLPFQAPPEALPMEAAEAPAPLAAPLAAMGRAPDGRRQAAMAAETHSPVRDAAPQAADASDTPHVPPRLVVESPGESRSVETHPAPRHGPEHAARSVITAGPRVEAQTAETPEQPAPVVPATAIPRKGAPAQVEATPAAADAMPEALLPSQVAAAAPRAAMGANPARSAPAAATEPTEVHVHIGRIEVIAVQAPAPAKRPARSGQAPMSLDAYLAKRQRSPS